MVKFEKKGLFKPRYSKTGEYSIGQITEAHASMKGTACHLVARLNDGKEWQCVLNVPSTTVGVDATMATRLATTNRWANAINMLIQNRT